MKISKYIFCLYCIVKVYLKVKNSDVSLWEITSCEL